MTLSSPVAQSLMPSHQSSQFNGRSEQPTRAGAAAPGNAPILPPFFAFLRILFSAGRDLSQCPNGRLLILALLLLLSSRNCVVPHLVQRGARSG